MYKYAYVCAGNSGRRTSVLQGRPLPGQEQVQCNVVPVMTEGSLEALGSWKSFMVLFMKLWICKTKCMIKLIVISPGFEYSCL